MVETKKVSSKKVSSKKVSSKNVSSKEISVKNFNRVLGNCVKDYKVVGKEPSGKSKYETVEEYNASFDDVLKFEKKFTEKQKKEINAIIFHDENNDGVFSAYCAWHYLYITHGQKDFELYPMKPSHGSGNKVNRKLDELITKLEGKNVLLLDLDFSSKTVKEIESVAKSLIIIDDHNVKNNNNNKKNKENVFIGLNHATVAYAWKFFYPKEDVPMVLQYVDDSDAKLFLPYVANGTLFVDAIGFRFVHNKMIKKRMSEVEGGIMSDIHMVMETDSPNMWLFMGKYFNEVKENLKYQIAINAQKRRFMGHNVAVLNFNAPGLKKPVGRQIVSNFESRGDPIEFAVLWGYEYTSNGYDVTMIDSHKPDATFNLGNFARELAKKGGHPKGGGGHPHEGHFYWPRGNGKDIWDLFQ